jgi:hypothetical protein
VGRAGASVLMKRIIDSRADELGAKQMTKEEKIADLQRCVNGMDSLSGLTLESPEFIKWKRDTEVTIEHCFPEGTRHINEFRNISFSSNRMRPYGRILARGYAASVQRAFVTGLEQARAVLRSMIEELTRYGDGS